MKRVLMIFVKIIVVLIAIIGGIIAIMFGLNEFVFNRESIKSIFEKVEDEQASVTKYIAYGTHLNIEGEIPEKTEEIRDINLVLIPLNKSEVEINVKYEETENGYKFHTSDLLNKGINLEEFSKSKYYIFAKVEYGKNKKKYYSLGNKTDYKNIEYYTITRENTNNKVVVKFDVYDLDDRDIEYMQIEARKSKLPKDVYDIVIDPGHGGSDTGAEYGGYREADLTLEYSQKVKEELEKLGLKVLITRTGNENEETFGTHSVYDEDGRVNLVGKSKAKYVISIHLNSITEENSESGVEVYTAPNIDFKIAKTFSKNIVEYAKTNYSTLTATYGKMDGVYARTFKDWEIEDSINDANSGGYEPYNITENTPYLYMIRETGGIATGAYVDGRNKEYGKNNYYNSNIGVEAYLLELGYLNNDENLKSLIENKDGYVKGIVETVKQEMLEN